MSNHIENIFGWSEVTKEAGDHVKSILSGWGKVTKVFNDSSFMAVFGKHEKAFCPDGRRDEYDISPEIIEFKKKKWEPKGGDYFIDGRGTIWNCRTYGGDHNSHIEEGRAYESKELAKKAYSYILPYQRLIAYLIEHCPEYQHTNFWQGCENWTVEFTSEKRKFIANYKRYSYNIGSIFMPKETAEKLAEELNSGVVDLKEREK